MNPSPRQLKQKCPCGSNKAFKNCHGQDYLLSKRPRVPSYRQVEEDAEIQPPGYSHLIYAALYDGEDQPRSDLNGQLGQYELEFTLLQPGQAAERVKNSETTRIWQVQNEKIVGDSHLAITVAKDARPSPNAEAGAVVTVPIEAVDSSVHDAEMLLIPNKEGRLSKVSVTLKADNFSDAEHKAYFSASSVLSHLSFALDIPLRIAHTYIKETDTGTVRIGFVRQFGYKGLGNLQARQSPSDSGFEMDIKPPPYSALTSIYREALNTESPFYQFLCYCRIIQRLKERLRPKWQRVIAGRDPALMPKYRKSEKWHEISENNKRVPASLNLEGKKFYTIYEDQLRPLRNGIGHVFLEDMDDEFSEERSTDEYDFVNKVYTYLPVAHDIARRMIEVDFSPHGLATLAHQLES